MKTVVKAAWLCLGISVAAALASFLLPVPSSWQASAVSFHVPLANSIIYTLLHLGAAVLFLMGIKTYKAKTRVAYCTIVAGIVILALGVGHVAALTAFGLLGSAWVQNGGVILPFLLAGAVSYTGVRAMARQVGVRSAWTRYSVVIPLAIAGIGIAALLPHAPTTLAERDFDVSNMIIVLDIVMYLMCALIALQVKKRIGGHYTGAMAWLTLGFLVSTIVTILAIVPALLTGVIAENYVQDAAVTISGLIYLKAGVAFAMTREV